MRIAVYAGSFDPVTNGHIDIIKRSTKLFDKVIVAILNNSFKNYWFNLKEREELIRKSLEESSIDVEIDSFDGLLVDFMKNKNATVLIRGLRAVSDYEYELQLALTNDVLSENSIETIFLTASRENLYLSASIVKDIALNNGELKGFVNEKIIEDIKNKVKGLR
ncbi:MAG: pantetheine-phosphate adenylyltransferase [Fusobacteriaceae bacterium]|nr:pantetheine-phosphate adenylyltransferase [Fusobacteriaceae bacterium]